MVRPAGEDRSIERIYAHFHRVLAELLAELTENAQVTWLETTGHELTGDYRQNTYNPAIYIVPELEPYRAHLAELLDVQAEALETGGQKRPGRNLLPPLAVEDVTHVRISRYTGQTGRTITRESALTRLRQLEQTTVSNLKEFEQYATRHDPARKRLEAEIKNLRKAISTVEKSKSDRLRESYRHTVIRPYIYTRDGNSQQLHMRNTGLIAAGSDVSLDWRRGPRRTRSDKIRISPLASAGALDFYDLAAWEAAKSS